MTLRLFMCRIDVFFTEQLCRTVAGFIVIQIFIKSAVLVRDTDDKSFRGYRILNIPGRDTDALSHGHQKQCGGEVIHLDDGDLPFGCFFCQHPVLRIGTEQFLGMGNDDGLSVQLVKGNGGRGHQRMAGWQNSEGAVPTGQKLLCAVRQVIIDS